MNIGTVVQNNIISEVVTISGLFQTMFQTEYALLSILKIFLLYLFLLLQVCLVLCKIQVLLFSVV